MKAGHFRTSAHATGNAAGYQDVRSGSWMQEAEVGHNTSLPVIIGHWLDEFERELTRVALGFNLVCT